MCNNKLYFKYTSCCVLVHVCVRACVCVIQIQIHNIMSLQAIHHLMSVAFCYALSHLLCVMYGCIITIVLL